MATLLTAQSLATVSTSLHGLTNLPERRIRSEYVRCSSSLPTSFKKLTVARRGQRAPGQRRSIVRIVCEGCKNEPPSLEADKSTSSSSEEDVDLSHIVLSSASDVDLLEMSSKGQDSKNYGDLPVRPPKFSTLRAFGEGGEGVISGLQGSVFELLVANIKATADLRKFETLTGRVAMLAFFFAIGVEFVTANSVFDGIDLKELACWAALAGISAVTAAGFAVVWQSRTDVASSLSKGALKLVDATLDTVIDGLFYDEEGQFKL